MASESKRKISQLADCTNTPPISRPRRSCGSYASSFATKQSPPVKSPQPRNPSSDANNLLIGSSSRSHDENEEPLRDNSSFVTPKTVLTSVDSLRFPDDAERAGQNIRVYGRRHEKEGKSFQVTSSCPPLARGAIKSKRKIATSSEPENQLKNFKDSLTPGEGSLDQREDPLRVDSNCKQNLTTAESVLPALNNFQYPNSHEDTDSRNTRDYSKHRQKWGRSSEKVPLSCPPLQRAVHESKWKTRKSSEAKNPLKNIEDSLTPARGSYDENIVSLSGNDNCKQNSSTPHEVLVAVDSFQFPGDNEDTNFQNIRIWSMPQELKGRRLEKVSLSCPPLERAVCESTAGESTKVRKRRSLGAWDDLPESQNPKRKTQRRRNSLIANEGKYSLPQDYVREQQAHFAEVDAFVLQEEDSSDAD